MAEELTEPGHTAERPSVTCPSCGAENKAGASICERCGNLLDAPPTAVVITIDLKAGSIFDSRYEILGPLGRGGMGMVYKARDRSLDEVVAIKVLRPDFAQDPKMTERFKSEIRLARKVRHRNVCTIHDYGEDRGLLYISMELIEGVDLKHILKARGGLPLEEAYDLAIQVAEGLQAVHEAGIIHRDLKAPNIMRDTQGYARLMDFGIAKRQGGDTMTATGQIVGTPEYMSPEQAQGHKVDFRSDVYALGIVVYEIFTGAVPFRGETPISTILKHLHDPPPLDGPSAAALPQSLRPVLRRALAKDPDSRYASARDVAEALRAARSPSRRQQPVATAVLNAPTLTEGPELTEVRPPGPGPEAKRRPSRPSANSPRPSRTLQPWLLAIPAIALAGGALLMTFRAAPPAVRVADGPSPALPMSAPSLPPPVTRPAANEAAQPVSSVPPSMEPTPSPLRLVPPPTTPRIEPRTAKTAAPAEPRHTPPPPSPTLRGGAASTPPPLPATPAASVVAPVPIPTAPPATTQPPIREAEGAGSLQVVVKPWGEVTLDGKLLGTTPLDKIALAAGAHTVRIRHPAYEVWERRIAIRDGQTERVVVDFPTNGVRKQ